MSINLWFITVDLSAGVLDLESHLTRPTGRQVVHQGDRISSCAKARADMDDGSLAACDGVINSAGSMNVH